MQHFDVAKFFGLAYTQACTPANVTNRLRTSGIFPLNPLIFPDSEFQPTIQDLGVIQEPPSPAINAPHPFIKRLQ